MEYIFVENQLAGEVTTVKGPCVWFPRPYDKPSCKQTAIALQVGEYIRLKDTVSGERWVVKGKDLVFLEPTWRIEGAESKDSGIRKALVLKAKPWDGDVIADDHHCYLKNFFYSIYHHVQVEADRSSSS